MDPSLEEKIKNLNSNTSAQAIILAAAAADEAEVAGKLHGSRDEYIAKKAIAFSKQLEEGMEQEKRKIELGSSLLRERLEALPQEEKKGLEKELDKLVKGVRELISANSENIGSLIAEKASCETMQEVIGCSSTLAEWMYQVGLSLFNEKKMKEAEGIYIILLKLNHLMPNYWIALGLVKKELKELEEALFLFNSLTVIDPDNPMGRYHSADLYLQLNQVEDALTELKALAIIIEENKQKEWQTHHDSLYKIATQKHR